MIKSSQPNAGRSRIAIAGATGRVGSALIARLASDTLDLVALTRNPGAARQLSGTSSVMADFDTPLTLDAAMCGVERLFLAHGSSPRQVSNEIALIDAAVAAGVSHIVKLSAMGPPSKLHPFDWHMQIEAHLSMSDVGYTVIRPTSFVDIMAQAGAPVAGGTWGGAAGDGLVNFIDTRDVAAVARIALLDNTYVAAQRAYHLTGPKPVSMAEIAAELSRLLGRTVSYRRRSSAEQREVLLASGLGEPTAEILLGLDRLFLESALAETTSTVADLTGSAPTSVADWLGENVELFKRAPVEHA